MFRFTIRDVLWLTVVVGLAVVILGNNNRHRQQVTTMQEQADQLKRESKVWQTRAQELRSDLMTGTNKNSDVEFIPDGLRYTPKRSKP